MAGKTKKEVAEQEIEATEKIETTTEQQEEKAQDPEEFLANFDWHKYEEGIEAVDDKKLKAFDKALEGTVGFVDERQVIDGTVVRLTDREAIIDINSKSEGCNLIK